MCKTGGPRCDAANKKHNTKRQALRAGASPEEAQKLAEAAVSETRTNPGIGRGEAKDDVVTVADLAEKVREYEAVHGELKKSYKDMTPEERKINSAKALVSQSRAYGGGRNKYTLAAKAAEEAKAAEATPAPAPAPEPTPEPAPVPASPAVEPVVVPKVPARATKELKPVIERLNASGRAVVASEGTDTETLQLAIALGGKKQWFNRSMLAENKALTVQAGVVLARSDVGHQVALNVHAPKEALQACAKSKDELVRANAAQNPSLPLSTQLLLAEDDDQRVRHYLRSRRNLDQRVLDALDAKEGLKDAA